MRGTAFLYTKIRICLQRQIRDSIKNNNSNFIKIVVDKREVHAIVIAEFRTAREEG